MDAATRDTRFADAMERVVSDAVREKRRRADAFRRMAGERV
jgi:hypothetical protein